MTSIRILTVVLLFLSSPAVGQLGIGVTYGVDLYQHLKNPVDSSDATSVGSALVNLNIGPKLWFGYRSVSVSVEAQVSYAPFAFDTEEYKGLGAFSFPVLAQINIGGLSTLKRHTGLGAGLGIGTTFFATDLYLKSDEYEDLDVTINDAVFGQASIGFGTDGFAVYLYGRYGEGDSKAHVWNVGVMLDYNLSTRAKVRNGKWE